MYIYAKEKVCLLTYAPQMNKKFLSILLSVSLLASSAVYAVPKPITDFDTAAEATTELNDNTTIPTEDEGLEAEGPRAALSFDTALEQNTVFGVPEAIDTASLSADTLSGSGTEQSPYLITNADELMLFSANINQGINSDAYYKLTSNIDLGGAEWTPAGHLASSTNYSKTFRGVFDGSGFTVSNFKITKASTSYIGFFGYIYEGTVKNLSLDGVTIDITSDTQSQNIYIGTLAGRIVTVNGKNGGKAEISNCNVTSSSLTARTMGTIYAGGLSGSAIAGEFDGESSIVISMCDIDCDIDASSASVNRVNLALGGFIGYLSSEKDAAMRVMNCNAFGSVTSDSTSISTITTIAGGMFGLIMTFNESVLGGEMSISSCHSEGDIVAKSIASAYAAGFAGQISASDLTTIKDCYSSSNVSGYSKDIYTVLGGFMGMTDYYKFSSENGNNTIINCYSAGDVIDINCNSGTMVESYVGAFVGYTPIGIFKNCYKLESQMVVGRDISVDDIGVLNVTEERKQSSYVGFDFNKTWHMDTQADFFYPTLIEKIAYVTYMNENVIFGRDVFGTDGKIIEPSEIPTKEATIDKSFSFSHWSFTKDGAAFDFGDPVYENITLYAVFTSSPREYKVNFILDGEKFIEEVKVVYGGSITAPATIPTKADEGRYYYEFSHWSLSENGAACVPDELTASGDMTFYAVFTQFDRNMWTGSVADSFASGYGTAEMPYMIERAEELALMQKVINQKQAGYENAYFALGDDINLGGNYWMPIGTSEAIPFSGHFDGNGFRISNYKVADNRFAGFFGYVKNGTIKNVHLASFEIAITYNLDYDFALASKDAIGVSKEEEQLIKAERNLGSAYVGGVAGYVDNISRHHGEISGIRVSADKFEVSGNPFHIYAGGIIGLGIAHSVGSTTIHDCFVTSSVSADATAGYAYAGGIAARLETTSSSISKIVNCYNIGDVSAKANFSSYAGGLVGYLYSHGSAYAGTLSDSAVLSAGDKDTMIMGSFAVTNVSAQANNFEYVGYVAGLITAYADIESVLYAGEGTISGKSIQKSGTKIALKYLTNKEMFMSELFDDNMAFDFENTWTYLTSGYEYPILKCMVSDKPGIKIISASLDKDGVLDISAKTNSTNYIIVVSVYSARNQMLKFERIPAEGFIELELSYDGMEDAAYVRISAVSSENYKPLFEAVSQEI